ncbi:MAG: carbohydrate ABC transporter permease [Thermoleophilia bacterium]|nr:carbohydrate ABC transporter permease [Thermoleophilia bacterium]
MAVAAPREKLPPSVAARPERRRRPSRGRIAKRARNVALYAVLVPFSIVFIAPFAWLVSSSLKPLGDIFVWPPQWIPENPTLANYELFLGLGKDDARSAEFVGRWFLNSAFVALSITALQLFFNSLAAYAFAKREFPGRTPIFILFLATMMIPGQVTLIPTYLVIRHMPLFGGNDIWGQGGHGWLDSYYGLILPGAVSAFGIFFLRQYMLSIPNELLDAARIDGASEFRIYWKIILPLTRPALAATGIFTFMYAWEDFFWPLIIITSPDLYTVPLGLTLYVVRNRTAWDIVMAGSVLATLPMILMFVIFQRHIIRGITLGGLKG